MRGTAELSSAMPCINRLGWTNQPSWCLLTCWLLTQYLNNALWSSYVTQTTDRGSSGRSHCSGAVVVTSSETRMTGVRVTVHFCLAIIMVQPSSRHTISSHYTAWPQHTAHWTVIPNKQAEYAAPVCPTALVPRPTQMTPAGCGEGGARAPHRDTAPLSVVTRSLALTVANIAVFYNSFIPEGGLLR